MAETSEKLEFALLNADAITQPNNPETNTTDIKEEEEETNEEKTELPKTNENANINNELNEETDSSSDSEQDDIPFIKETKSAKSKILTKRKMIEDEPQYKTWFSITCDIFQIDLNQQQYHAHIRMNIFWNDRDIVRQYKEESKQRKRKHQRSFKEFLFEMNKHFGYYLPMDILQMKNFKNAVSMVNDIETVHLYVHKSEKGDIPQMVVTFDGILSEQFQMSNYPFDKQFINVRVSFNVTAQHKFRISTTKPGFVGFKEGHDYFTLLKASKGDALTDWDLLEPWIDLHHFEEECFLIRLRLQRKPSLVIVRIIVPLLIVSIAPFMLYALDVTEYADRLSILATLLLTLVAFHSLLNDSLPPSELSTIDWYIIISYISMLILGVGVCISDEDNKQFPFELASYVSGGLIVISGVYLFLWRWVKLVYQDRDKSWKYMANKENADLSWKSNYVSIQKRGIFAKAKFFTR